MAVSVVAFGWNGAGQCDPDGDERDDAVVAARPLWEAAFDDDDAAVRVAGGLVTSCVAVGATVRLFGGHVLPRSIALPARVDAVACGGGHGAAAAGGAVYCWGDSGDGQCGVRCERVVAAPRRVDGVTGAIAVACGERFTAAADGADAFAWGANDCGQVGRAPCRVAAPARVPLDAAAARWRDGAPGGCDGLAAGDDHVVARLASVLLQ